MRIRTAPSISKAIALAVVMACAGALTGCAGFFQAITTTTTTTNTGTGYDLVYAGKNGTDEFVGYAISSSGLTAVTGSPFSIGSAPLSMAINPANSYLYVGTTIGIYGYSIAAGGGLTALNSGAVVANTPAALANGPISMDISPDGNWLAVLTANSGSTVTILVYQITTTTGLLTYIDTETVVTGSTAVVHTLKFSPNEDLLVATLGSGGTDIFTFNGSTGAISTGYTNLAPPSIYDSDNAAVVSDTGTSLYLTRGGSATDLEIYPINATTGSPSTGAYIATGNNPTGLAFNNSTTQPYIYVTNSTDGTISGYSITTNSSSGTVTLASLGTSPYSTSGTEPYAIAYDNTDTYMVAMNQTGPPDLLLYTVDTTTATAGRLYVTGSVTTGLSVLSTTVGPGITMVTTH